MTDGLEKNNVKNNKKRNIIIVLICLIGLSIVLIILNAVMDKVNEIPINEIIAPKKQQSTPKINYQFHIPDYDYNIMDDMEYIDKNRYIEYTNGAVSVTITDGKFSEFGKPLVFFNEYFNAAINGDYETYNNFFSDEYYAEKIHIPYEKFTMQRIYNINVEFIQDSLIESGINFGDTMYLFKVSYMIMKNDGTFRDDMGSDGAVPLLFEIIYDYSEDMCYINNITQYNYSLYG